MTISSTTAKVRGPRKPLAERIAAKAWPEPNTGCLLWSGASDAAGYGHVKITTNVGRRAHRAAYELHVGPIPYGLELDHLCRTPSCVNPAHLEPVTHHENWARGTSPTAVNSRKTHCANGHELSGGNIYNLPSDPGRRRCRICASESRKRTYRRAKAKRAVQ